MRGGFLHNQILIAPVEGYFRQLGARIHREYPVTHGRKSGFVDLFVVYQGCRIVCEVELSPHRVCNDLAKAIALSATLLLIVVPNARVARAARKRLAKANLGVSAEGIEIFILSLPLALQRLRNCFPLMTPVNVQESSHQRSWAQHQEWERSGK